MLGCVSASARVVFNEPPSDICSHARVVLRLDLVIPKDVDKPLRHERPQSKRAAARALNGNVEESQDGPSRMGTCSCQRETRVPENVTGLRHTAVHLRSLI